MLAAIVFGNYGQSRLEKQELSYYALACVGFLVAAGAHSFDEVMIVAHKLGLPYSHANYLESIPKEFAQSEEFQKLRQEYSTFFINNTPNKRKVDSGASNSNKRHKNEEDEYSPPNPGP